MRYRFIISIYCCLIFLNTLSGQCPERGFLWNRIIYLRDTSGLPFDKQLSELMPYADKMKDCYYRNDSTHALLLQRIGGLHIIQKDYVKGIEYIRQSVDIVYKNINRGTVNSSHLIRCYNNLRIAYDSLKNKNLKLEATDSCIAVALRLHTGYESIFTLLIYRISDMFEAGDYYRSINYATIADNIAKEYQYGLNYRISVIAWKINSLTFLKRFDEAEVLLNNTIAECDPKQNANELRILYPLSARIALEKGDVKKALLLYKNAFAYNEKIKHRDGCAGVLNNTGYLVYFNKLNQYNIALQYYYKALPYAGAGESLNIYDNIANVYVRKELYDSALLFFQKGFDQIKPGINEKDLLLRTEEYVDNTIIEYISNLVLDKADTYIAYYRKTNDAGKLNQAVQAYKTIDRLFEKIKARQNEIESMLFWRKHIHRLYENAIGACYLQNNPTDAFYFFEKSRAVLLNDGLNERRWLGESDILKQAQEKKKILQLERELDGLNKDSSRYTILQKEIFTRKQELDRLQQSIKTNNPLYFQRFLDSTFITIGDVQKKILKDHRALVELFAGDTAIYVLMITATGSDFKKINKKKFDNLYSSFITAISSPELINRDFNSFRTISHELYLLLFQNTALPKGRILISLAGQYFPFEALITSSDNEPLTYFLEDHAVSYTYSARYLLNGFADNMLSSSRRFMGVAPVQYADNMNLTPLSGSDQSLQRLKNYFSNASNLVAADASKNNFLKQFFNYKIIQLYTHATDSGYNGEPVIYFADSSLLLSDLIYGTRPATNLVILSACETGKGRLYQGEGVFSFNRGFASLGIPSSVSNLWQVDNESTYKLTELFYKYLAKGLSLDVALQKAKMEFIKTSSREKQLAYYWAAPVLIGDSAAIKPEKTFPWKYLAIIAGLIPAIFLGWRYFKNRATSGNRYQS